MSHITHRPSNHRIVFLLYKTGVVFPIGAGPGKGDVILGAVVKKMGAGKLLSRYLKSIPNILNGNLAMAILMALNTYTLSLILAKLEVIS